MQSVDPQDQGDVWGLTLTLQQIVYREYIVYIFNILGQELLPRLRQQSAQIRQGYKENSCDLLREILDKVDELV